MSKKRAAETMLEELKKLPPPSPVPLVGINKRVKMSKRKPPPIKKKTRNLIKEQAEEDTDDVNPISRLIHISQGNKAKDPVYTLVEERGPPRRREFVMEVFAVNQKAVGVGSTKKLAKRQAAESMFFNFNLNSKTHIKPIFFADLLSLLGFCRTVSPTIEGVMPSATAESLEKCRKVTFSEQSEVVAAAAGPPAQGGSAGRQLVPGLLLMQQENKGNEIFFCAILSQHLYLCGY